MFKLFRLKLRKELEELKSIHRIELAEAESKVRIREAELTSANESKVKETITLLRLEAQQKQKQMELDHQRDLEKIRRESSEEVLKLKETLVRESYEKLSGAMQKLHEEGNLTTKFTQELALSMMKQAPQAEVKVLTGSIDVK